MADKKPLVTLEEAYWWLNNANAPYLRPPLYELLARFQEAEKTKDRQAVELTYQQFLECEYEYLRPPARELVDKLNNAVKIWIEREVEAACKKLNACGGSFLRNPTYVYVLRMRVAVQKDPANARVPIDRLYTMSRKLTDGLEAGEALVECGCAMYRLGNREGALRLFHEAIRRYTSYMHQFAVVYWMIGYIHWELGQLNKALVAWRKSVSHFEKLASQRLGQAGTDTKWYSESVWRMNLSIQYAIDHEMDPQVILTPPPAAAASTAGGAAGSRATPPVKIYDMPRDRNPGSASPLTEAQPIPTNTGDLLEALPVIAEVPAGPWKQTRGDRNVLGHVTIDQVFINNEPHFVKNLRGGHIISLASIEKHVVIKITGNSMNASEPTPIEDGDYVLLRRQNTAQAGDIVVAKILDPATRSALTTIKRFLVDGHPLLKAESTDPNYGKLDEEFKIDGLAIAVFKPVYKTDSIHTSDTEPI